MNDDDPADTMFAIIEAAKYLLGGVAIAVVFILVFKVMAEIF